MESRDKSQVFCLGKKKVKKNLACKLFSHLCFLRLLQCFCSRRNLNMNWHDRKTSNTLRKTFLEAWTAISSQGILTAWQPAYSCLGKDRASLSPNGTLCAPQWHCEGTAGKQGRIQPDLHCNSNSQISNDQQHSPRFSIILEHTIIL